MNAKGVSPNTHRFLPDTRPRLDLSTQPSLEKTARKRSRLTRVLRGCAWLVVLLTVLAVGAAFWVKERELVAPDWLRDEIEVRLNEISPEARVRIGSLMAVLEDDWRPRFSLRNVEITRPDGARVVSFSDVRGQLDRQALLERRLGLRSLEVSGVFVTLRRSAEGRVAVSTGPDGQNVSRQSDTLAQLVGDLGGLLSRPGLAELTDLDILAITLRYEDERANRAWTVDGGRVRLDRDGTDLQIAADLALLGGGAGVATLAANYAGVIGVQTSEFGITIAGLDAADIATQGPAFGWLRALDAPISGALRGGLNEDGSLRPLNATLQIGAGVIQPTAEASPIPIESARSYFTYLPDLQELRFDELSVQSQWGSGRMEGAARLVQADSGRVEDLIGQVRLSDLRLNPMDFYTEPEQITAAELDFRLRIAPFALEIGRLQVSDLGQVLTANGSLSADSGGWNIAMDAQMDGLSPERLLAFWPQSVKPKSRRWISENVFGADLSAISGALRLTQGGAPRTFLGFDFAKADVRFVKTLPRISDGKGHATLVDDRFVVVLDEGGVQAPEGGFVDGAGSAFIIPDVRVKPDPPAIVRLTARGSTTAALSLLDQEPLRVMQKAGLPVTLADGDIEVNGTIAMPLKKKPPLSEISYDVVGSARDVRSDVLIMDRTLAADELEITASDDAVSVAGQGTLDGVPLDVVWRQPLGEPGSALPSQVTGSVEISQATLDAFNISLPPGLVQGQGVGRITIDIEKNVPPALRLQSDLRGISMSLPPINWSKQANADASLEVTAALGSVPKVDRIALDAPGLDASGVLELTSDGQLERLRLSNVSVGGWLNGAVDLVGRGKGVSPAVVVRGGSVDMRRADLGRGSNGAQNTPLTLNLDRLQVSDTIAITDMRGRFNTGDGLAGTFEGRINGAAPVSGELIPQGTRSAIRITSGDAGRVFAAANLLKQARGGQMELVLNPVGTGGAFDGQLKVRDARIKDAPAIAALLNAISIVGLVNELAGDGIYFDEINADFRLGPQQITLREASAVGASMGISMDGIFLPGTGQIQMQGVISPVYLLNAIGSVLTRRGEGLFGFNYSIEGTAQNPQVFVNPLTALAPGMFRNLFRRAPPEAPVVEGETPPAPEPVRGPPKAISGSDR